MHLPDLRDEPRKVGNRLPRRLAAVVELALVNEIPNKRLLYGVRRTIGDRIVLEHPFALADVDGAELPRRCQYALEELGVDGYIVFGRELKTTVVDDSNDPLRDLVSLLLVGIALRRFALRGVIVADALPRLILRNASFDVFDRSIEQELRRHEPVHLLQPYRGRPRLGALAPPRLASLNIFFKIVHIQFLSNFFLDRIYRIDRIKTPTTPP